MRTLTVEETREKLSALMEMLTNGETVVATQDDEGRLIVHDLNDLQWEAGSLARNQEFMADLDASRTQGASDASISLNQLKQIHEELLSQEALAEFVNRVTGRLVGAHEK